MSEILKTSFKLFNTIFPYVDFVYILQLEEYDTRRYWRWLPRFFLRRDLQVRQRLAYTPRAIITIFASAVVFVIGCALLSLLFSVQYAWFGWLVAIAGIPVMAGAANLFLSPLFELLHARMRAQAAEKLARQRAGMKVVVVAGSYGKTTTKGFIEQLARHHYRVQMPPGSINTPSGISAWIRRELQQSTTLLIIEADGYSRDEYLATTDMVPADIAVITNIGDQHLERFGSRAELAEALAEVFLRSQQNARLIAPAPVAEELHGMGLDLGGRMFQATYVAQSLKYRSQPIEAAHLSASQREDLALALAVADALGIPERFVLDGVRHLTIPERRQRHGELFGYNAIDDSYNISISTATASIAAARETANKEGKKLLVITAGIPELGPEIADGNNKLGALLAQNADHAVILGSVFAREIMQGMGNAPYTVVPTLKDFQTIANTEWPPHQWFLLLLPELNDLYY